jgi:mannose/cellobiose epimerase-like protein (N-acyl-D-glucosamine 2-epimerase family)
LRDWAVQQALPLWASTGFDREHRRFEERLTLRGERIVDVPIRLMVQARQIYCYGLAAQRGWHEGALPLVEAAFQSMIRDYHRRDGADGWVFSVHRDGAVADGKRDLYAHAFVLLAVASYVRATKRHEALEVADETLAYLDRDLRAPAGGYLDAVPPADALRRQNPHMHVLEGLLSLWAASGEARYLRRAQTIVELFRSRFFQPDHGILAEYFDVHLKPAPGVTGTICEPGHHYEWVWLLRWFERATGQGLQPFATALYVHADRYGYDGDGLIVDELRADGTVQLASHRAWPMTEAIKASVAEAALGRAGAADRAAELAGRLMDRFLLPIGGWMDRLDAAGRPAVDFMPASTLYHVLCAVDELDRFSTGV